MILRKPYALFIKSFKMLHLLLAIAMGYLLYRTTLVFNFFGEAMQRPEYDLTRTLNIALFDFYFYLIPALVIVVTGLIMAVLVYKQKPFKFYVFALLAYIAILAFNFYLSGYLLEMETRTMSAQSLSLMRDFVLICWLLQFVVTVKYFITGIGFDIKQFDFSHDLEDMAIEEVDREEFEVSFQLDFHAMKRKLKNRWREFKYFYYENKFLVTTGLVLVFLLGGYMIFVTITDRVVSLREGDQIVANDVLLQVNESFLTREDYRGNKMLEDDYLLVLDVDLAARFQEEV